MSKDPTPEQIEWLVNDTLSGVPIDETLQKLGCSRREFNALLKRREDIKLIWEQAQLDACPFLEDDLLNLPKIFRIKKYDPKMMTVMSANIMKVLAARKPEKYGNKIDLNVNQNISIKSAIEGANKRLAEAMRDVTPAILPAIPIKEDEDE